MTPQEIAALGPAFADFLQRFEGCFFECRVVNHFRGYCRGLLSDLPRKSVEPIALAAGATVRSMQEFLAHLEWDHAKMGKLLQQRVAAAHAPVPGSLRPAGDPGVIGLIDECAIPKKGSKTPGVQRQYCGASGKIDNCIVNVHLGYLCGRFQTLIDAELFLPESWAEDRPRCREAHIPDELVHRTKTEIALELLDRARGQGLHFDFLTFDEHYGQSPKFLQALDERGQHYVAEVPSSFHCWPTRPKYNSLRREFSTKEVRNVVRWSQKFIYQAWQAKTIERKTMEAQCWQIKAAQVLLRDPETRRPTERTYWLIHGWNKLTGEHKYWISNAPPNTELELLLQVAFKRAAVEHLFRIAKSEIGMDHYEGRSYLGLMRHLVLCQLVMLFLAEQTDRLRGEKSRSHARATLPRAQQSLSALV